MFLEERINGYIGMHQGWCNSQNIRRTTDFNSKLETWKYNALFEQGKGRPAPPRPEIPKLLAVDVEKCRARFLEWETGLPQTFDFYIETPLPVPLDAFDLTPKGAPQPADPVSFPDGSIPGQYLVAQGDQTPAGKIIDHPKYGRLVKVGGQNPFGGEWYRWITLK